MSDKLTRDECERLLVRADSFAPHPTGSLLCSIAAALRQALAWGDELTELLDRMSEGMQDAAFWNARYTALASPLRRKEETP